MGITTLVLDIDDNIFYTIIYPSNKYSIFILKRNGYTKELLQGDGINILIFYLKNNLIVVNQTTMIVSIYSLNEVITNSNMMELETSLSSTITINSFGTITNVICNNGILLFLFNNNIIYKLANNKLNIILSLPFSINAIILEYNNIYGIIFDGTNISSQVLITNYH